MSDATRVLNIIARDLKGLSAKDVFEVLAGLAANACIQQANHLGKSPYESSEIFADLVNDNIELQSEGKDRG